MKIDKNTIIKFLLLVCVIVIAGQFVLLHTMTESINKFKSHLGDLNATRATVEYRNCELQCIGRELPDSLRLSSYDSPIKAKEVLGGRKTLVYFFSQMYCKMCIESQIEAIKAAFGDDSTNIVLLANSSNYRELYVMRKTLGMKCPIYKIDKSLNLPADTMRMPYFVLLDENLKVLNAFITMKERMNYSVHYLKSMYSYFNSGKSAASPANISIDRRRIELGNVKNGSSKAFAFAITNNSTEEVKIDVIPDCDCTVVDYGDNVLHAKEQRQVNATIRFDSEGEFSKFIYVYRDGGPTPVEIEVHGYVN